MELAPPPMSVTDYLAKEQCNQIRHEYLDGLTFPMRGESRWHHLIVGNVSGYARSARASHGCRVFTQRTRVRVPTDNCFYYPDIVGSRDVLDGADGYLARPCFALEVASLETASIDRREKRCQYLTLESLEEYVIVHESCMHVSRYFGSRDSWTKHVLSEPGDVLQLTSLGIAISLEDIYSGVELPQNLNRADLHLPVDFTSGSSEDLPCSSKLER